MSQTPILQYRISDPSHIENMLLQFLRTVLTIPLLTDVKYNPDRSKSTLLVDIAENITNKEDNVCPAVLLSLGDTTYEEMAVDQAAQYTDPKAASLYNAAEKLDPIYTGAAKRTLLRATTPVTIEARIFDRLPCAQFTARLAKIMFAFSSNLHRNTNAVTSGQMSVSRPVLYPAISATAYSSTLSFSILNISAEDIPEIKNVVHQFFMTISTINRAGTPVQEINMTIDTRS